MNKTSSRITFLILLIIIGVGIGLIARQATPENEPPSDAEYFAQQKEILDNLLAQDPDNLLLNEELAKLYYNYNTQDENALEIAEEKYRFILDEKLRNTAPDEEIAMLYYNIGNIRRELNDHTGAVALFEQSYDYNPDNNDVKYNIGYLYVSRLKDPDQAEIWFEKIGNALQDDPSYYYWLGRIYFDQERYPEAEVLFEKVMRIDPDNASIVRDDIYRRTLEAQGKELPESITKPGITGNFEFIEDIENKEASEK